MVSGNHSRTFREDMRDSRDRNHHRRERDSRDRHSGAFSRSNGELPMHNSHYKSSSSRNYDRSNTGQRQSSKTQPYHYVGRQDGSRPPLPSERWERRLQDAKKDHRPRLKNWERGRFGIEGSRAEARFEALRWDDGGRERHRGSNGGMKIARERREELSSREFWEHYERRRLPVVVSGIPWHEGWRASERWTFGRLGRSFRECKLKCGEDDDGYSVKVKLKYFLQYMEHQRDDSPLYIFDSHFDDYEESKPLLEDYSVPDYFPDDLFSLVGERRRPPYRWFLVGPKRSGTSVHIDPLGTSAWNTVIRGRKLWVVFPPSVEKRVAKAKDLFKDNEDDEPINYFVDVLPRIRRKYGDSIEMYEFVQYPGDTVFVPGGWWHAVLNLDDTIAITQNFCSRNNFEKVWRKTRTGRKKMAVKWLKELDKEYPALAATARRLNAEDGFVMAEHRKKGRTSSSDDSQRERDGDDNRRERDGDDNRREKDGDDNRRERDSDDNRREKDGDDNRRERDGDDNRRKRDGDDNRRERDGDDSRRERDADRKKRGESKPSKRKGAGSGSDNDEDGEDSGSGRSGTSSSNKKRGRRDQWSDGSTYYNGLTDCGDQRGPSASDSVSTPPTHNGSPA